MIDRLPPQSLEAEQSVLGAILIDHDAVIEVAEILRPEDFYRQAHGRIYAAMVELFERREPVDVVTVAEALERREELEAIGGRAYLSSLWIAGDWTALVLLIGYPIAYGMARAPKAWQPTLLMLVILPFWTSFLIRVYAWIGILKQEGLLNQLLLFVGVIEDPLTILNTNVAVYIGIVYSYLPFMVLPLYAALERLDDTLLEAAADLGCPPVRAFWKITVPLSLPGIVAGCFLVFIPVTGEFVIPDLLGGSETLMIGKTLWAEFFGNRDWPLASAVAVVLLFILVVPIVLFQNQEQRRAERQR